MILNIVFILKPIIQIIKMKNCLDLMLCIFLFLEYFYFLYKYKSHYYINFRLTNKNQFYIFIDIIF